MKPISSYKKYLLIVSLVAATCMSTGAFAQNVDHTGLEELYGEPVTTSATGKPQVVSKAPVSMEIITDEEIKTSGVYDIAQLLRRYAGVDVSRNFRNQADVNIRGYNQPLANRLLVLINGRQVYMDVFGFTQWNTFPIRINEIKQIEIVRGPNTSLFGFNAASGVINIITYNPLYDDVDDVEARIGSRGYHSLSGMGTEKLNDNVAVRVSGERTSFDEFPHNDRINSSRVPNAAAENAFERDALNLDAQMQINDKTDVRFETGYNNYLGDNLTFYNTARALRTMTRHAKADLNYDMGTNGVLGLTAYHNSTSITVGRQRFNIFPNFSIDNTLTAVQGSYLFSPYPDHNLRLSAEYRHNYADGEAFGTMTDDSFEMDIYSAGAMWDWRINDKWTFSNAARVDHWTTDRDSTLNTSDTKIDLPNTDLEPDDTEFSFNSGLVYQVDQDASVRLSLGRGLHIPSLVELAFDENTSPFSELYGNPNLDTEINYTADLGYTRNMPEHNFFFGGNVVYQQIHDLIVPTVRDFGGGNAKADYTFENVGDSEAVFLELFAKGKLFEDKLRWNVNYTYSVLSDDPSGDPDHRFNFEDQQPDHKVNLVLDYFQGPFQIGGDVSFVSGSHYSGVTADFFDSYAEREVSSYFVLNARAAYNITDKTRISIEGFNLAEEHEERPFFVQSPLIGRDGANELGRTVIMSIRHEF